MEFEIGTDDKGKPFADKVTAADGSAIPPPDPSRKKNKKKEKEPAANADGAAKEEPSGENAKDDKKKGRTRNNRRNGKKEGAAPKSDWYSELDEAVKKSMESRSIKVESGRVFISVGDARLKVGTGGYITLAHASGVIAEGSYTSDKTGKLVVTWQKVLKLDGAEWKVSTVEAENGALLKEVDLKDGMYRDENGMNQCK